MDIKITNIKKILFKDRKEYLIVNNKNLSVEIFIDKIAKFLQLGIKIIHFQPDNNNDFETLEIGYKLRQLTSMFDAILLIEQRIDIAKIVDCDGVVLKETDIPIKLVKEKIEKDKIICAYIKIIQNEKKELILNSDVVLLSNNIKPTLKELTTPYDLTQKIIYTTENKDDKNFIKAKKYENII